MNSLLLKLPIFWLQAKTNARWFLPASYTVSVTSACNASCKTCNQQPSGGDLDLAEYQRTVQSISQRAFWLTLTGGEPFLRKDLLAVATTLIEGMGPLLITIPTNGSLPGRVGSTLEQLASRWPDRRFIVNVSLDEIEGRHDQLRGLPGSWERALQTLRLVKGLKPRFSNIIAGVHTVISRFNVERFPAICDAVLALEPDSYITEIAGEREELRTINAEIAPSASGFQQAMDYFTRRTQGREAPGLAWLISHLRELYYQDVTAQLAGGERPRPCHAGNLNCHILADGRVTACGVRCDTFGNLRDVDYQLPRLWRSPDARRVRRRIKAEQCQCTMANQAYLNLALDPRTPLRLARRLLRAEGSGNVQ